MSRARRTTENFMQRLSLTLFTLACAAALCACSGSEKESFGNVDHDKDGKIIYEEAFFVFPDLTQKRFAGYDANADGALNLDEYVVLYASETAMAKEPKPGDAANVQADSHNPARKTTLDAEGQKAFAQDAKNNSGNPGVPDAPAITNEDLISVSIIPSPEDASGKAGNAGTGQPEKPAQRTEKETPKDAPTVPSRTAPAQPERYTVARGDILIKIAQKFNMTVEDIIKANPGLSPDNIREGQELRIPAN